jgi:RHS repeat-associated protein
VLREYEYQRTESGASPYFPNLRFPGHYWDAETDLHENWHRYYSPFLGQYLSPEPLLQEPSQLKLILATWLAAPVYGYANNNPLRYIDPDGNCATCKCEPGPDGGAKCECKDVEPCGEPQRYDNINPPKPKSPDRKQIDRLRKLIEPPRK